MGQVGAQSPPQQQTGCFHDLNWNDAYDTRARHITGATHHYVGPRVLRALHLRDPSFHIL